PPRGALARACAGIAPTLAHHRSGGDLPEGLSACYSGLCAEGDRPAPAGAAPGKPLAPVALPR
ncbi:MAG TPA: hypothetical protein VFE78_24810, partial [Gemmataceae bacterium]|nr:hypothetical protein [Gemmataceae bacterium]